ncbi:MAG: GNAT family N-acetyltransferase [Clostridiales bacterium]|nr:GNAT family N-acetyltransferase [Clostridiales bacterium]
MMKVHLVEPTSIFEESFKRYAQSYEEINDEHYFRKYKKSLTDFKGYIKDLENLANGINLIEGDIPTSIFWLIYNEEVVGVVRVRHEETGTAGHIGYDVSPRFRNKGYGNEILKLSLLETKKLGIETVVLTCSVDNLYSKKIIENNNGKIIDTIYDEEDDEYMFKFIINNK